MKSKKTGMSLIEILVATVVLGVVLVPIISLFFMNLALLDKAWDLTRVMAQVENKMEDIRSLPYGNILSQQGTLPLTQPTGSGVITINNTTAPNSADLLRITISATWNDTRDGLPMGPVVVETFVAKRH